MTGDTLAGVARGDVVDAIGDLGMEDTASRAFIAARDRMREVVETVGGDMPAIKGEEIVRDAAGDAEQRAARTFDVTPLAVSAAAHRRWGHGLTAERDARVADRTGGQTSARSLQAVRGHVTRELLTELQTELGG